MRYFRAMAHPVKDVELTEEERGIVAMALSAYRISCQSNVKVSQDEARLETPIRRRIRAEWLERSKLAGDLFNLIVPADGSTTIVRVRRG